jgi:hypothetical protein
MNVTVDLDGGTLVAVKTATGAAAERLRHEAERLEAARHPGVVDLVTWGDLELATTGGPAEAACEMRTVHAGDPLTRWTGSLADVAGVAAAVAATLADLHDTGIVHGRLDASHVLLGDGSRPRLCGWSGPAGATPADDVAAWGRLVDELVERVPSPRGLRGGGRGTGRARRGLLALTDSACDPIPTRRPSARALADEVMAAVPGATLPGGGRGTRRRQAVVDGRAETAETRPEGDTLDRIWSYAGEPSEAERWAAAFGSAPAEFPEAVAPSLPPTVTEGPPPAATDALAWFDPNDSDLDDLQATRPRTDPATDGFEPGHPDLDDPPQPGQHIGDLPPTDPGDDRTRDHVPVGARGRVEATLEPPTAGRPFGRAVAVVGAFAVLAAVGAGVAAIASGPGGGADASRPAADGTGCPAVVAPAADVDGDGCREVLVVSGTTVDAGVARWTLGEPGDLVAVGDWDCDGQATVALLRPASGDVFLFDTWAALDRPVTVAPTDRVAQSGAIRAEPAGTEDRPCDRLVVDLAAGGSTIVAVPG